MDNNLIERDGVVYCVNRHGAIVTLTATYVGVDPKIQAKMIGDLKLRPATKAEVDAYLGKPKPDEKPKPDDKPTTKATR